MTAVLGALCAVAAVAWACVPTARITLVPTSGPPGTSVRISGSGFPDGATARIRWDPGGPEEFQYHAAYPVQEAPFDVTPNIQVPSNLTTAGERLVEVRVGENPNFQAAPFTVTIGSPNPNPGGGTYQIPNPFTGGTFTSPNTVAGPTGSCQGRANTRVGTSGRDVINGTSAADVISGRGGNDVIRGRGGADRICGGGGRDNLSGGPGGDRLAGNAGNDKLAGGSGRDRLAGGSGRDRLAGGSGRDRLSGGGGKDRLNGGSGRDFCLAGSGDWATRNCE